MFNDFAAFVIFVLVTSITPGPNNITSMSFCLNQGYRKTLPYLFGIICGLCVVQTTLATLLFTVSSEIIADIVTPMKYVGAAYILFLAYKTLMLNINWGEETNLTKSHFLDGFLFQAINPKLYFFSITILTTFVNYENVSYLELIYLVLSMAAITFVAVSIWGGVGALIKRILQNPLYIKIVGVVMSLSLVYTAYLILK